MAEHSDDGNHESPGVVLPPKSPEEGSLHVSASHFNKDLKSVLVTSVLNLETLDVDLYR